MRKSFVVVLALLTLWPVRPQRIVSGAGQNSPIRIGVFLSLTGATAGYGISSLNSFKLATEEVNRGGGIAGRQVELVTEDDHSNGQEVAGIVGKLIKEDKVHAL